MIWGNLASYTAGTKAIFSVVMFLTIAFCATALNILLSERTRHTEFERNAQNVTAASLYRQLATLPQPASSTDVTRALLGFIHNEKRIKGATLLDAQEQLLAQLGAGNEQLLTHPDTTSTARIPIRTTNNEIIGHAIVAFQPMRNRLEVAYHYMVLTTIAIVLVLSISVLICMHWHLPTVLRKRRPLSWFTNAANTA